MGLCHTATLRFHGNVVALWEGFRAYTERTGENLVELGSDQTSLHNPYNGGMLLVFFYQDLRKGKLRVQRMSDYWPTDYRQLRLSATPIMANPIICDSDYRQRILNPSLAE